MTTSCWGDVGVSQKKQFREDSCDFVDKKERDESTHVTLTRLYLLSCCLVVLLKFFKTICDICFDTF